MCVFVYMYTHVCMGMHGNNIEMVVTESYISSSIVENQKKMVENKTKKYKYNHVI